MDKQYPFIEYVAKKMAESDDSAQYWEEYEALAISAISAVKEWIERKQSEKVKV